MAKIVATTNKDPKFEADAGFLRRLLAEIVKTKFVPEEDYVEGTPGMFIRDKKLLKMFKSNSAYQLAFAHIILPYATKYYEKGLTIPKALKNTAKELCISNDPTREFVDEYFKVTKDPAVCPQGFIFGRLSDALWTTKNNVDYLVSEMKKFGVDYIKDTRLNGKRSCFIGIKQVKTPEKNNETEFIEV
jgi:phage/plasmid-associated DNA primase